MVENNFGGPCEVCKRLSREYEAATMEWYRVQGQLRVAEYSRERESSSRIVAELGKIAERRHGLREALDKHQIEAHPRTAGAGSQE